MATGLALTIFGTGSQLADRHSPSSAASSRRSARCFRPSCRATRCSKVLFGYSPIVYFALIMVFAVGWFLKSTRAGLILRAVGENDLSAPIRSATR